MNFWLSSCIRPRWSGFARLAAFPLTLRWQEGYDHSYHFIATFIGEHLAYHAHALRGAA